jgi:hypothetical protein
MICWSALNWSVIIPSIVTEISLTANQMPEPTTANFTSLLSVTKVLIRVAAATGPAATSRSY